MQRSPGILPCDFAQRLRGWLTVHPWTGSQLARILASHPSGLFSAAAPLHRGPGHCASCAAKTKQIPASLPGRASLLLLIFLLPPGGRRCQKADEGALALAEGLWLAWLGLFAFASLWRAGCALTGPRKRWRQGVGKARRVGARDAPSSLPAHGGAVSEPPEPCAKSQGRMPGDHRFGVPSLWLLFFGHAKKSDSLAAGE